MKNACSHFSGDNICSVVLQYESNMLTFLIESMQDMRCGNPMIGCVLFVNVIQEAIISPLTFEIARIAILKTDQDAVYSRDDIIIVNKPAPSR